MTSCAKPRLTGERRIWEVGCEKARRDTEAARAYPAGELTGERNWCRFGVPTPSSNGGRAYACSSTRLLGVDPWQLLVVRRQGLTT